MLARPLRNPCRLLYAQAFSTSTVDGDGFPEPPDVRDVGFRLTREQARSRFDAWCGRSLLSARQLWDETSPEFSCERALLPFWAFEAEVDVRYRGRLGFTRGGKVTDWRPSEWAEERRLISRGDPATQVYASFALRRDFVASAVKGNHAAIAPSPGAARDPTALPARFQVSRALAWTLARRHVEAALQAHATDALRAASGASAVADLELVLSFRRVSAMPLRLPAYVISYAHGTALSDNQAIVPMRHTAVVGGASGSVAADGLLSPWRAQLAAAAPLLAAAALAPAASSAGPELAFLAAIAGVLAGVAARRLPAQREAEADAARLRACDAAISKAGGTAAGGPAAAWMDEGAQANRDAAEWRRWEETGLAHWDAARRAEWARSLFAQQQARSQGRAQRRAEQLRDSMRSEEEARREAARRDRRGEGREDPLGHYRRLGLADRAGLATEEEIKAAFRKEAHLLHPDKQQGSSSAAFLALKESRDALLSAARGPDGR